MMRRVKDGNRSRKKNPQDSIPQRVQTILMSQLLYLSVHINQNGLLSNLSEAETQ